MEKLKNYFAQMGFAGQQLDAVVNGFKLQPFKKNDMLVFSAA